jgi:hypothetical protein
MTRYGFRRALGAFFLADRDALSKRMASGLVLVEPRPGHAVIAVTAFDFDDSEVGAYRELVISALVAPFAPRGGSLPHASTFPFLLATTTDASRSHAAERWYLPELPRCLDIAFESGRNAAAVHVREAGAAVLDLEVSRTTAIACVRQYQCWSERNGGLYRVDLAIEGPLDEHEEERGRLLLHDSPVTAGITACLADDVPLCEQSMEAGEQRFETLVAHTGGRA